jgi:hypothetical protein
VTYTWYDLLGNAGVVMIVGAYVAVQIRRLDAGSLAYSVWNAVGAGLITISLCFDFNLSAFLMELVWVLVSVYGIVRCLRERATPV